MLGFTALWLLASEPERRFEDIGLGKRTSAVFLSATRGPFHCASDPVPCVEAAVGEGAKPTTLWLGASQLHGVNAYVPGELTAPYLLEGALHARGERLIALSPPNANAREHLVLFEAVRRSIPLTRVIVGAVLDDAGEGGLRPSISDLMHEPRVRQVLEGTAAGRSLLTALAPLEGAPGFIPREEKSLRSKQVNPQERVESWLDGALSRALPLWAAREQIRGRIYVAVDSMRWQLIRFRSWITGRSLDDWVLPLSPADYAANLAALDDLVATAAASGIKPLIYIAPRPINANFPYAPDLYRDFKKRLSDMAARHGGAFVNLEDAVVGDVWGSFEMAGGVERRDIFHFTAAGHKQLYGALRPLIGPPSRGLAD